MCFGTTILKRSSNIVSLSMFMSRSSSNTSIVYLIKEKGSFKKRLPLSAPNSCVVISINVHNISLKFLIPEIFLSLSTFTLLMVGVFLKKSFEIVYRLSILVIFLLFLILLTGDKENTKVFNESFLIDEFSLYSKVLILISAILISQLEQMFTLSPATSAALTLPSRMSSAVI